jgi:uncharacterized delta-60 repeat protein
MTRDPSPARRTRARRPNFRPRLEALEERCLLNAGGLDLTFGPDHSGKVLTDFAGSQNDVALQADGKLVVSSDSAGGPFALVRYNADGSLDTTFGTGGLVTRAAPPGFGFFATDVEVRPDGVIVAIGHGLRTDSPTAQQFQYLASFSPDNGSVLNEQFVISLPGSRTPFDQYALAVQGDNKVLVGGDVGPDSNGYNHFHLERHNADLTLDTSFGVNGSVTLIVGGQDSIDALAIQGDGKIVAAGAVANGLSEDFALARFNPDGSLDDGSANDSTPGDRFGTGGKVVLAFDVGTTVADQNDFATAVAIEPDGKLVAAGTALATPGDVAALARFNADGSLDDGSANDSTPGDTFGTGGKVTTSFGFAISEVSDLALQANGKIVVCGNTGSSGSTRQFVVARYNPDGRLDGSFGPDGNGTVITPFGSNDIASGLALQPDGKIVAVGSSDSRIALARYQGDPLSSATVLNLTAANATYTGAPYDTANLTTTITPAAASGSVSYVFYSDAGGQNAIADPTNAGTYYVQAVFTSSDPARFTNATSAIVPFTIPAKSLSVDATTQGTLNIAKAGTISFALQITAGLVASDNNVASLFNGATFTIAVGGTSYSLTTAATVAPDGTMNVSMKMSQGLQNALLTALSEGSTVDFSLSALSNDGDYSVAADAISRLISRGKLKFAVT